LGDWIFTNFHDTPPVPTSTSNGTLFHDVHDSITSKGAGCAVTSIDDIDCALVASGFVDCVCPVLVDGAVVAATSVGLLDGAAVAATSVGSVDGAVVASDGAVVGVTSVPVESVVCSVDVVVEFVDCGCPVLVVDCGCPESELVVDWPLFLKFATVSLLLFISLALS